MTLDPTIAPIVELVNAAAAKAPPLDQQTVAERREAYQKLVAAAGPGPEVGRVYSSTANGVPIRTYLPTLDGGTGICVFFHGGGFVIGDLDSHDEVCRQLCVSSGAVVVSVDYRLAPESPFPAAVEDCWTALRWVADNATELITPGAATGVQNEAPDLPAPPIVVAGDSAGGNLAAVMAIMARDAGLELAGQALVYPGVTVARSGFASMEENGEGYVLTAETIEWFGDRYLPDGADPTDWRASPLIAPSHADLAPALVITAEYDPLRDEGIEYARLLADSGVEVTHTGYEGMVHIFFQLGPLVPKAAEAVAEVAGFIANHCR